MQMMHNLYFFFIYCKNPLDQVQLIAVREQQFVEHVWTHTATV
jgi:hypothetical protein